VTELPELADRSAARAEKLRAIAAVFGDAMAARIGAGAAPGPAEAADPARLAWQTNRLIQHLRDRVDGAAPDGAAPAQAAPPERTAAGPRLPVLAAGEDLAAEHPAVIAHILRGESQEIRVSVLRALPGHVSRAVIQRLRPAERPRNA
jgi:hypothetical protein